jgi:hypothetical protein
VKEFFIPVSIGHQMIELRKASPNGCSWQKITDIWNDGAAYLSKFVS